MSADAFAAATPTPRDDYSAGAVMSQLPDPNGGSGSVCPSH
ncbi:MAG TPA: hypothetical protein VMA32_06135 [Streptosporangiaceae bacterium]|nr:hypothetical protein [Streptosporangiaceae bacterium]